MAAPPLLDLSTIDLSETAVSAETVGNINPQCGPMRQLDRVIWLNEATTLSVGIKQVTDDEFWVPYHTPQRALMPGVLMIEAAAQLFSIMFHLKSQPDRFLGFTRCTDTAFRGQVVPGDDLILVGSEVSFHPRRYTGNAQGFVDGNLVFESTITGMTL